MSSTRTGYVNPTDRVAAACIEATRSWCSKLTGSEVGDRLALSYPRRHYALVLQLLRQLGFQGLSPDDLDNVNGTAALCAVADAIFNGPKRPALFAALSAAWKPVANAAERILDRATAQPR